MHLEKEHVMALPMAADYPFLDILWSTLIFVGLCMWIWLVISIFADVFRRHDIGGFTKALWIIFVMFIPLFGVLVYLIAYDDGIAERTGKQQAAAEQAFDQRVREATGNSGPASEIATAEKLRDAGTITQDEFVQVKAKAVEPPLSAPPGSAAAWPASCSSPRRRRR
jgi:hypothetical protein